SLGLYFFSSVAFASSSIRVYEVPAFYNFQKRYAKDADVRKRLQINPVAVDISEYKGLKLIGDEQRIGETVLTGETIYKSFVIENLSDTKTLSAKLDFGVKRSIFNSRNTALSLVTTWFQAGNATTFTKDSQYLTHELLLNNDVDVSFDDDWVRKGNKWYYQPPEISRTGLLTTRIGRKETRRLLLEIQVPKSVEAGSYQLDLVVSEIDSKMDQYRIGLDIEVSDVALNRELKNEYSLFIFTMLSLDPNVGRTNSFINGQNFVGSDTYQTDIYQYGLDDIADKGFNGVFVLDWRPEYAATALSMVKKAGLLDVIIYGQSFIEQGRKVADRLLVDVIRQQGFTPIFYGYDEPGGNERLLDQIQFNRDVHALGAESINAIFWDDYSRVKAAIADQSEQFEYLTVSMGSHGNRNFLNNLPLSNSAGKTKILAYWHPHVESPVRNKLFMGYWLWASGLDGVSPHAYYVMPHIAKYKQQLPDRSRGRISPYNDFSMWTDPNDPFRQHATVYPEKNGFISTLQWEAVKDGVTDLILIMQVENMVGGMDSSPLKREALALLREIRVQALVKDSSAIEVANTDKYMYLMADWKRRAKRLLIEFDRRKDFK
ncbi:MAG: hypothetical protein KC592_12305, partial [Nitrospira sp.]|nr:hypothetical protein [Nitrospira sp.]